MYQFAKRMRRAYAPYSLSGRPLLENIVQPLYSTGAFDATTLPAELNLFQYAKGQAVPGAGDYSGGASTMWHTNMETPSSLAAPKVFTITGIRVHLSHLGADGTNTPKLVTADLSTTVAAPSNVLAQVQDALKIFNAGVLKLTVGPKTYANHPCWFFPSNIGVGGLNDVSTDANGLASTFVRSVAATHQVGQYWDFYEYPVVIAAQQSFGVNISFTWATNPSLTADRALTVFLDGVMSREVA